MPKMKTRRGAAKRFWISKNGKVMYKKAFHKHKALSKSEKRIRKLRIPGRISRSDSKKVKRMLGV